VTSLLDRAITLATEASNGTLNSTQEGAATRSTSRFCRRLTISADDHVQPGAGIQRPGGSDLHGRLIHGRLFSGRFEYSHAVGVSLGDTGGKMAYSSGSNSVFVNMSSGTANAQAGDALDGGLSGANT